MATSTPNARHHNRGRSGLTTLVVAALAVVWLGSCVTKTQPKTPGARLARSKCGGCHPQPERGAATDAAWTRILDDHQGRFPLTEAERDALHHHFTTPGDGPRR